MRIADSYFVKFANGTSAWMAVGKDVPDGATVIEVRPILMPDDGMILRNKETGEESTGHWLRGEDSADKWEEIEEPKEDVNG
jgi:hypothetical protein